MSMKCILLGLLLVVLSAMVPSFAGYLYTLDGPSHFDNDQVVYNPTTSLIVEVFERKNNWGFKAILRSDSRNQSWINSKIITTGASSPLADTDLLFRTHRTRVAMPIKGQQYFIIIDRKSGPSIIENEDFQNVLTGHIQFKIVELAEGFFDIDITRIGALIDVDLKGRQRCIQEGVVDLSMAPENWYTASVSFAGCVPLTTSWKNSRGRRFVTESLDYPAQFSDSGYGEQIRVRWQQW